MIAVVLAAGKGTRLKPLTDDTPKVMIPVEGKSILEYNLENLAAAGLGDVFINLHHLPDRIRDQIGDGRRWGLRIRYSYEREILGTSGAVKNLERELAGHEFLVIYGDNFPEIDLPEFIAYSKPRPGLGTIAVFHKADVAGSGILEISAGGMVTAIKEKPGPHEIFSHWVNAGIYFFRPGIFAFIPEGRSDFAFDVFPAVIGSGQGLSAYLMPGRVWAIDSRGLLDELEEHLRSERHKT